MAGIFDTGIFDTGIFDHAPLVAATIEQQPAGGIARGKTTDRRTGPAFPSVRELYRQPIYPAPEQVEQTETEPAVTAKTELTGPSPLPIMMDFGKGRIAVGMTAPSLSEAMHNQILADDEDAITAILLALQ